jgi:hypothetical protein
MKLICNRAIHARVRNRMLLLELDAPINTGKISTSRHRRHIKRKRHTDSNPWMTRLQIDLIPRYKKLVKHFKVSVLIVFVLLLCTKVFE